MKQTPANVRRKFDETFKREAVSNWLSSGKSAGVIGGELGVSAARLYVWKKRFAPADTATSSVTGARRGSATDLQSELDATRRELARVRVQRDILKKTLGILSEPPASDTNGSTR